MAAPGLCRPHAGPCARRCPPPALASPRPARLAALPVARRPAAAAAGGRRVPARAPCAAAVEEAEPAAAEEESEGEPGGAAEEEPDLDVPAPQQKIRIKLKAYFPGPLEQSCEQIIDAAYATGATVSGPVFLPTRRKIWTVLRSPHVNKDSREQFELRTHSRLMDVYDLTPQTIDELMKLELPAGVDVQVKL